MVLVSCYFCQQSAFYYERFEFSLGCGSPYWLLIFWWKVSKYYSETERDSFMLIPTKVLPILLRGSQDFKKKPAKCDLRTLQMLEHSCASIFKNVCKFIFPHPPWGLLSGRLASTDVGLSLRSLPKATKGGSMMTPNQRYLPRRILMFRSTFHCKKLQNRSQSGCNCKSGN